MTLKNLTALSVRQSNVGNVEIIDWAVQRIADLEEENKDLKAHNNRLRIAALNAIHFISGGDAKAELRDAYDETPYQSLAEHDAGVIERIKEKWVNIFSEQKEAYSQNEIIDALDHEIDQLRQKAQEAE